MEGTILLAPASYYAPPPVAAHPNTTTPSEGIGARLAPSARLIDESIADLRALAGPPGSAHGFLAVD